MTSPASDGIEVRRVTADEWMLWRAARLEALRESPAAFGSQLTDWIEAPESRWRERLSVPGAHDLLAIDGEHVVGMITGMPVADDPSRTELISMWVAPSARGTGLAADLIDRIVDWATEAGASVLDLSVMPDNPSAHRAYERAGFTPLDEPGDLLPDGRLEIRMRRTLR